MVEFTTEDARRRRRVGEQLDKCLKRSDQSNGFQEIRKGREGGLGSGASVSKAQRTHLWANGKQVKEETERSLT